MMSQEEYVNEVLNLRNQGWTISEIADKTKYHPATVSKWLKAGGPPPARKQDPMARVIDAHWAARIDALLAPPSRILSTSVYEVLQAEGFTGSYPSVVRYVRARRGPRFSPGPKVSVPIETAPGEEAQFDFSDCSDRSAAFGLGPVLWCFSAVLCWSRYIFWWFTTSVDREHTFEGLVRSFEAAGGVAHTLRTDRMGALGSSQGRRFRLHPPTLDFARWHSAQLRPCQAYDAKRKGKVERPFRRLEEGFLEELAVLGPPGSLAELNSLAGAWLAKRVNGRPHRVTGAAPAERLEVERPFLLPLPRRRYDTAYAEARRVHVVVPFIEWKGVRYSVHPDCLGQRVACREEVDSGRLVVTWAGREVASHALGADGTKEVWDAGHRHLAESIALGRPRLRLVPGQGPVDQARKPSLLDGYDVEAPDLQARYGQP
jgi:transposase